MTVTKTTPTPPPAAPGAPTAPDKTSSGYSLPTELHDEVRRLAAERGFPASYLVELALRDYLPRLIPVDELVLARPAVLSPTVTGHGPLADAVRATAAAAANGSAS